jgi:hypothetical protein
MLVTRRRLLFVSPRFLFPLDEGGKIRTTGILRAMKGGAFDIVLASPAPPGWKAHAAEIATICDRFVSWPKEHAAKWLRALAQIRALAGALPIAVASDQSTAGAAVIAGELAEGPGVAPDLMVVDFPHAAVLMPDSLDIPSVLFTHNIEAEIYERHAAVARGAWKLVWQREAAKMRRFEGETLRRFSTVVAVSARDGKALAERFGLSEVALIDHAGTVVFSGAMNSRSNIDGIGFLMDEVWPRIIASRPDTRMRVVGRNPPGTLVAKAERLGLSWHFTGFVDDIRPHVLEGDVAVIPLRVGSGTRLKAFEAMALGRPVVSTALGMEGLGVEPGKHFLAAETADDFADAILRLLSDAALRQGLASASRQVLEERFSWSVVGRQFEAICTRTVERQA